MLTLVIVPTSSPGFTAAIPIRLYEELCEVVDDVLASFQASGRTLPEPITKPMREVA